jgi:hypothetical protein
MLARGPAEAMLRAQATPTRLCASIVTEDKGGGFVAKFHTRQDSCGYSAWRSYVYGSRGRRPYPLPFTFSRVAPETVNTAVADRCRWKDVFRSRFRKAELGIIQQQYLSNRQSGY